MEPTPGLNNTPAVKRTRPRAASGDSGFSQVTIEHYLRLLYHRKLLILGVFALLSTLTFVVSSRLADIYVSETVIHVDPQKVPDAYIKSTVTGDIRNRLGTLSQQILSATRLQKLIDMLNLYPEERKRMAREDVIALMRRDISVQVVSGGGSQDLQAFRIQYSGREPRLVARVANELAAVFIAENLKAREQQAAGTAEFLQSQLTETRKTLEAQEAQLKDFRLRHLGEMPEQQTATMQILGQLQSQLQLESDALSRAEQQRAYTQSMAASQSNAPVVDIDTVQPQPARPVAPAQTAPAATALNTLKTRLAAALSRYSDDHPDVRRLRRQIRDEEAKLASATPAPAPAGRDEQESAGIAAVAAAPEPAARRKSTAPIHFVNPVLESQLRNLDAEISRRKEEQQRLMKSVAVYRAKLEAVPIREQQITELVRDYETSKAHYQQLLDKQLSADTATQLEIRQKGEQFKVLDPAQPAQKPSYPNRALINAGGCLAGLVLGLALALVTELLGVSITTPEQITAVAAIPVLQIIPVVQTHTDRVIRRRVLLYTGATGVVLVIGSCAALLYQYGRNPF
jgi:polysaccharide chain length determinant protein (PEP-CTERM system associated)